MSKKIFLALSILVVAAFLKPSPKGLGTHTQLGQNTCGFYERTDYPCPTCGMTTMTGMACATWQWGRGAITPGGQAVVPFTWP